MTEAILEGNKWPWCWTFLGARLCSYRKVDHVGMQPSNDLQGPEEKIVRRNQPRHTPKSIEIPAPDSVSTKHYGKQPTLLLTIYQPLADDLCWFARQESGRGAPVSHEVPHTKPVFANISPFARNVSFVERWFNHFLLPKRYEQKPETQKPSDVFLVKFDFCEAQFWALFIRAFSCRTTNAAPLGPRNILKKKKREMQGSR